MVARLKLKEIDGRAPPGVALASFAPDSCTSPGFDPPGVARARPLICLYVGLSPGYQQPAAAGPQIKEWPAASAARDMTGPGPRVPGEHGSLRLNLTQHGETHQVQTCEGLTD